MISILLIGCNGNLLSMSLRATEFTKDERVNMYGKTEADYMTENNVCIDISRI